MVGGLLDEAIGVVLDDHLDRAGAEAVGDGEHDLLHLRPELVEVDGAGVVVVELVEDGVIERGQLLRRGGDVNAEVGLDEPQRLEPSPELGPGQHAVAVNVQHREPLVDALLERRLVVHERPHRGAVDDHHRHFLWAAHSRILGSGCGSCWPSRFEL